MIKKIFAGGALVALVISGILFFNTSKTSAAYNSSISGNSVYSNIYGLNYRYRAYGDDNMETRWLNNYSMSNRLVIINTDNNFLLNHGYWNSYVMNNLSTDMSARRIIIRDRDNMNKEIFIRNIFSGSGSFNTVTIDVDDAFFNQLLTRIDSVRNNINLRVNTGNNTVMFNTVTGDISTGSVNISIR